MKVSLFTLFLFFSAAAFSQSDAEQKLSQRYQESYLEDLRSNNPAEYQLLVYAVDNACEIVDLPQGKTEKLDGTIQVNSGTTPAFTDLNLELKDENQYFRIAGTNKMLVVKSKWLLKQEMNKR